MNQRPELAGIRTALLGSLFLIAFTILFAFPIGVGAAIYLEEYADRECRIKGNEWSGVQWRCAGWSPGAAAVQGRTGSLVGVCLCGGIGMHSRMFVKEIVDELEHAPIKVGCIDVGYLNTETKEVTCGAVKKPILS